MAFYRFYWIGVDGHIKRAEDVECYSDHVAEIVAAERKGSFPAIEIWLGARKIARIGAS